MTTAMLREPHRTIRVVIALMLREMSTTYGRSPGGYIWKILEPIAGIAVLSLVFSVVVRSPPLGISFPLFYATGVMPYRLYGDISGKVAGAVNFSRPFLVYPTVTFMDAILARLLLGMITECLLFVLIFWGLTTFFDTRVHLHPADMVLSMLMAMSLGIGIGSVNCVLTAFMPLWGHIWGIANRPMFMISGIFFTYESLPVVAQKYLWFNPLVHIIGVMRRGVYDGYTADYVSVSYVMVLSGGLAALGLYFLKRYHRVMLNEL